VADTACPLVARPGRIHAAYRAVVRHESLSQRGYGRQVSDAALCRPIGRRWNCSVASPPAALTRAWAEALTTRSDRRAAEEGPVQAVQYGAQRQCHDEANRRHDEVELEEAESRRLQAVHGSRQHFSTAIGEISDRPSICTARGQACRPKASRRDSASTSAAADPFRRPRPGASCYLSIRR
jgi:hypothetical protein